MSDRRGSICHFTSVHPRHDVRIFEKECSGLAKAGWETTLVVADGLGNDCRNGVVIVDAGTSGRGRLRRMLRAGFRVARAALRARAAVYQFHDPELLPFAIGMRILGQRMIYDVHEDVPRQLESKRYLHRNLRRLLSALVENLETYAARRLNAVIAATPTILGRFAAVSRRSALVRNYPLASEFADVRTPYRAREPIVLYVGSIGVTRGAYEIVDAAELIEGTVLLAGPVEHAAIVHRLEERPGWKKVRYLGRLDRATLAATMAQCRVGLVVLHPTKSYRDALPTKLFEYMAAGLPVVASDFPIMREIIVQAACGVCVDPLDPRSIAAAVNHLLAHPAEAEAMGRRGRASVLTRYVWETEERAYHAIVKRCLPRESRKHGSSYSHAHPLGTNGTVT